WLRLIRSYGVLEQKDRAKEALAAALKARGGDGGAKAEFDAIAREFHLDNDVATPKGETPPQSAAASAGDAKSDDMIKGMVSRLATRLEEKGGTADEWLRLIRSYGVLEQKDKAKAALAAAL